MSDIFIILDNVQFEKSSSGTWSNRVKLKINKESKWVTAPIKRNFKGYKKINEVTFSEIYNWRAKIFKTIEHNYKKAPHYKEIIQIIKPIIFYKNNNLLEYNLNCINSFANELNMFNKIVKLSSNLNHKGKSNDFLISLGKSIGAHTYLSGQGSKGYMNDQTFNKCGIKIIWQNIEFDAYDQGDEKRFISGLSIIDTLMFAGKEKTINIIKANSLK